MLEDLQPETLYSIRVAAYTIKGDGAQSVSHLVRTPVACESSVCVFLCVEAFRDRQTLSSVQFSVLFV